MDFKIKSHDPKDYITKITAEGLCTSVRFV